MENNMKIRGVNLGNWLVLEKWMSPALFEGTKAEDEDALCRELPRQELIERLTAHRGSYITREDFIYISERGLIMVRIPVPHFIFGDDPVYCEPYVPCIEYLDRAFDWAGETGLQILIDLHTAPESQNGFDNGGICGVCKWAQSPERIDRVLKVLGMLAERYKSHPALWGIQLLNEPISEPLWQMIRSRYLPQDPERAAGSSFVPLEVLYDFYTRGYHMLRSILPPDKKIVFHDGFRFEVWDTFFREAGFENVVLDAHWYLGMGQPDEDTDELSYMNAILKEDVKKLKRMEAVVPVIIGEWCLSHNLKPGREYSALEKQLSYRLIGDAQLMAWESASGYFFWSYKLLSQPEGWDFRKCVEKGWLPDNLEKGF